jgi:DNA topoisomerase-1
VRESTKYEHVVAFAIALPSIREKLREHMALRGLPRQKVLATVVHLLESTLIRVGNDDYAKHNNSYGLTTLKNRHVAVDGNEVRFRFTGKSDKQWSLRVRDKRIAKIIKACQELPGQELIQYVDEERKLPRRHIDRCERLSQGNHRQGHHRERFPYLGRDGSRGDGSQRT